MYIRNSVLKKLSLYVGIKKICVEKGTPDTQTHRHVSPDFIWRFGDKLSLPLGDRICHKAKNK